MRVWLAFSEVRLCPKGRLGAGQEYDGSLGSGAMIDRPESGNPGSNVHKGCSNAASHPSLLSSPLPPLHRLPSPTSLPSPVLFLPLTCLRKLILSCWGLSGVSRCRSPPGRCAPGHIECSALRAITEVKRAITSACSCQSRRRTPVIPMSSGRPSLGKILSSAVGTCVCGHDDGRNAAVQIPSHRDLF